MISPSVNSKLTGSATGPLSVEKTIRPTPPAARWASQCSLSRESSEGCRPARPLPGARSLSPPDSAIEVVSRAESDEIEGSGAQTGVGIALEVLEIGGIDAHTLGQLIGREAELIPTVDHPPGQVAGSSQIGRTGLRSGTSGWASRELRYGELRPYHSL